MINMNFMMKLKKEFIIDDVIENINNILLFDIENELNDIINDIIYEFENDNIEIYNDDVIELFDIENELKLLINNELFVNDKINYEFYDDVINLINEFDDEYYIFNDVDEIEFEFDIELKFDDFNYYNSNDDLILYKSSLNNYYTINYYDIDRYFYVDDIVDEIINRIGI